MSQFESRPNPDGILSDIKAQENNHSGKFKIFFGYAAGVGKTYAMLDDAKEQQSLGKNVLVGYVEPHARPETVQLLKGLPALRPLKIPYRHIELIEFDLDEALKLHPDLILVDELAHTNALGVRNKKRYLDIEELLNAGIDVYTTVNVQHIESLNDIIENITKVRVQETVPDYIFERADKIKLIDIEPDELLNRFKEGKIYQPERVELAANNFFTRENLKLLREIALRKVTERIINENQSEYRMRDKMANTKLLVCIGPSPSSAKCIRWTSRAAKAFHAHWVALYVESIESDRLTSDQQKSIRSNMELVEKLGGEIVSITGHDIAVSISEYAKMLGITNIVVGKSRNKKTIRSLFELDLEDKLIALLPNIEVHIIPDSANIKPYKKPHSIKRINAIHLTFKDTLITLGLLIVSALLGMGLRQIGISEVNVIMVYILSVLVISRLTNGYIYGMIASVISVLTFNFFFTEPYYTFDTVQSDNPITFLIMFLVALITSTLTVRIKAQASLSIQRERRTEVLYEISKKLLTTRGIENIVSLTTEYIVNLFSRSLVFYSIDPEHGQTGFVLQASGDLDQTLFNSPDELAVAHWVFINQKQAGAGTDTLMGSGVLYMPVISQGKVIAVLGISCKKGLLDHGAFFFLRMITSQVAMALERQYLSDEQRNIIIEAEKEKMRSNLLRAIAHDLRTPLAGILGASSAISENRYTLDENTIVKLNNDIQEEAQWLIRMVENLLSVTRINEGESKVTKSLEAAEEVISDAVNRINRRFPDRHVEVCIPNDLIEVPMDGTLIAQVLINLLENAIKHSPIDMPVEIILSKNDSLAIFEVIDHGKGISNEDFPYLFTSYVPNGKKSSDSSRGMGIGLSICMTIIVAHGGTMEAQNLVDGGALFKFTLPLEGVENSGN